MTTPAFPFAPDSRALDRMEPIVLANPADDDQRERYVQLATSFNARLRAADALKTTLSKIEGGVRERVGLDVADLYLAEGQSDLAGQAFMDVVRVGARSPASLRAARRVLELQGGSGDPETVAAALAILVSASPEPKERIEAAVKLLSLNDEAPVDDARLGLACIALVGSSSPRSDDALVWLRRRLEAAPPDASVWGAILRLVEESDIDPSAFELLLAFVKKGERDRAIDVLLACRTRVGSRAFDEFVSVADELIARLADEGSDRLADVKRARARLLASEAGHEEAAVEALRELVEASNAEDDVRELERVVEAIPSAEERHRERRWLFRWRAKSGAPSVDVLRHWAKAEEEFGDLEAAKEAYERLASVDPTPAKALEVLCRLKLQSGDVVGGLQVLSRLTSVANDTERAPRLRFAALLLDELARPVEAAEVLAPVLGASPPVEGTDVLVRRMLSDVAARQDVIERFEQAAGSADAAHAHAIFECLLAARDETAAMPEARHRWLDRLLALSSQGFDISLSTIVRGAVERPDKLALWDAAERVARWEGSAQPVASAYHEVLQGGDLEPELAETLGRRMVAFEDERAMSSPASIEALLSVLDAAPTARWALDRVKLTLGSGARWDELFGLYDRAIDATSDDASRGELIQEAAFAAKDLAGVPFKAIAYLELLRALRPDDDALDVTLERLYERQDLKNELLSLLERRMERASGTKARDLRRRICGLWLDLGDVLRASAALDPWLDEGGAVGDVVDLLERMVASPVSDPPESRQAVRRAAERLRRHYERSGRTEDAVRVTELSLSRAQDPEDRRHGMRELVASLLSASPSSSAFSAVAARIETLVGDDVDLAAVAYRALLVRALASWRKFRAAGQSESDAAQGAFRAIRELTSLLVHDGEPERAFRLVHRACGMPFERSQRRGLLSDAAFLCADGLGESARAIQLFERLFDEDPADAIAAGAMDRFSELLLAEGLQTKLAARWEEQGKLQAGAGNRSQASGYWERAAGLWEGCGDLERAVSAYKQGAALESSASFEALARIYEVRGAWADAAQVLEWLYARATKANRYERALRLSDAYVRMGQRDRARERLEEVLRDAAPSDGNDPVRDRLTALYRLDERWRPLARLLSDEASRAENVERRIAYVREAAELLQSKLGELGQAADLLTRAIEWAPQDASLRRWLVDVLERSERWQDVVSALGRELEASGTRRSRETAQVRHRRARALIRSGKSAEAFGELRVAAEMAPTDAAILGDLGRAALEAGDLDASEAAFRGLLLAMHRPTGGTPDEEPPRRADVFLDLSEIALRKDDLARARDLVDTAFEEASQNGGDVACLEEKLLARGRYDLLASALERRIERGSTTIERVLSLGRLSSVRAMSSEARKAGAQTDTTPDAAVSTHFENVVRDLDGDFVDAVAWGVLIDVQASAGSEATLDRLIDRLESTASRATDAERQRLRVQLARLLLQRPARADAAIGLLDGVIDADPTNRAAIELLSAALERNGRFDDLVRVLERNVHDLARDGNEAAVADASLRLGGARERAGRSREALTAYESILDLGSDRIDAAVFEAVVGRLEALESARLADGLRRWLRAAPKRGARIGRMLVECRETKADPARRLEAFEAWLEADPSNEECREWLVRHYDERKEWTQSARVLRRALAAAPFAESVLGKLVETHRKAGEMDALARAVDSAIDAQPMSVALLRLRAGVRERAGDASGAVSDLERACAVDARHLTALADALTRIVRTEGASPSVPRALRLSDVLVTLRRPKEARAVLDGLRASDPRDADVLRRIAVSAAADGDWPAAADAYRDLLTLLPPTVGGAELGSIALATAEAFDRAGRPRDELRHRIEGALDVLSADAASSSTLERLCSIVDDWGRLADALVRQARAQEGAAKVRLLLRAGGLLVEHSKSPSASTALAIAEEARSLDPESVDTALLYARALVGAGRAREALALLDDLIERHRASRSLSIVQLELAKAHLALDELIEALDVLKAAFAADWRSPEIALLLGQVSLDLDDEKTADRAFVAVTTMPARKDAAGAPSDAAARALAFYHLASMAFLKGDLVRARLLATKAAGNDPPNEAVRTLLDRLGARPAAGVPR